MKVYRYYRVAILIILLTASIVPSFASHAQDGDDEDICADFIREVLSDLATNCANMDDNSACYGFETVEPAFTEDVPDDFFAEPAARTELTTMISMATAEMVVEESIWGIGVMHVQANIHRALPEQMIFVASGGVEIENVVEPETALLPIDAISIPTTAEANLYEEPDAQSELLGIVGSGTTLQVDGINPDEQWLRALYYDGERNRVAWVNTEVLDPAVDTTTLPTIAPDTRTPMQTFFLRNSFELPECGLALPPMLVIQGPHDSLVDFNVDGTDIRIDSGSIILQILPPGDSMRLITLYGMGIINPGPGEILVPPAFSAIACLTPPDDYGGLNHDQDDQIVSCEWSSPRPLTRGDLTSLELIEQLPDNILSYPIEIPTLISSSGVGNAIQQFFFEHPEVLQRAQRACNEGLLPEQVCRYLFR